MNIFEALSCGDGAITETNVSSFLGYLLNPNESHGLRNEFLKRFIARINNDGNIDIIRNFSTSVEYECSVSCNPKNNKQKTRDIDLVFELDDIVYAIENKTRKESVQKGQLTDEYNGLKKIKENSTVYFIFLSPTNCEKDYPTLIDEIKKLKQTIKENNDKFIWLSWDDICEIFEKILADESIGSINPLDDYVKSTIKAFKCFINRSNFEVLPFNIVIGNKTYKYEIIKENILKYSLNMLDEDGYWNTVNPQTSHEFKITFSNKLDGCSRKGRKAVFYKYAIDNKIINEPYCESEYDDANFCNTNTIGKLVFDDLKKKEK